MAFSIKDYLAQEQGIVLQPQQVEAVEAPRGPILLLAVPGAGKTTVLSARIAQLIHVCGLDPQEILTITFSWAGAQDMRRRYEKLFGPLGGPLPSFSTIHSFCYSVLRAYCRLSGGQLPQLLEGENGPGRTPLLREIYSQINHDFLSEDVEEELSASLSLIRNGMLTQEEVRALDSEIPNLWELYHAYGQRKRSANLMDFDDMLGYAYTALRKYPQLLARYRQRYPALCVDEAQDTSRLQHEVIRLLAAPRNDLFMVGDEDQSIYRFRGAHPQTLLDFEKLYPGARVLKMEENFRSSGSIVRRCAAFIAQNQDRYDKKMRCSAPAGTPIESPQLEDLGQEYALVLRQCKEHPQESCAVIYRNNFSAIPLVDLLERQRLDFSIRDQRVSFRSHYVIGDVLAFFALSQDPSDLSAFRRIFHKTSAYLKRSLLQNMDTSPLRAGESWFDRALEQQTDREQQNGSRAHYIASMIAALQRQKPAKALDNILGPIGYLDFLEYSAGSGFVNQVHKLAALRQLAARCQTVEDFLLRLEQLDLVIQEHSQHQGCSLTLTTAHAAKGLEFDTVILLDALDDIFPNHAAIEAERKGQRELMEEEARLFYVACTRARQRLLIPQAHFLGDTLVEPSRFISRLLQDPPAPSQGKDLRPGLLIQHPQFGRGQVMSLDRQRGTFVAFFQSHGTRTLSMDYFQKGLIKPL